VNRPGKAGFGDVAADRAADGAGARGRADDRNAPGLEKRSQGGDHGRVVAPIDGLAVSLGRSNRECDLDRPAGELAREVEPGVGEDAQHGDVLRQDLRDEALDARIDGQLSELFNQACSDPLTLQSVRNCERDLGDRRITQPGPARESNNMLTSVYPERPDERPSLVPIGDLERT
jgi:hypothetical protein